MLCKIFRHVENLKSYIVCGVKKTDFETLRLGQKYIYTHLYIYLYERVTFFSEFLEILCDTILKKILKKEWSITKI